MTLIPLHDHLDLMREHLREGQYAEVITLGQHVLRHYPKHLETYRLLGEACLETGDLGSAADLFNRVRSADPENVVALVGLSIVHEQRKQVGEAIWHLERAFEIQPANEELRKELLRLYAEQEGTPRERLKLTPGGLARLYARQGLYSQAIQEFRALLSRDSTRTDVQAALAETLYRVGRKQESAEIAQTLLETLPYCLKANLLLGALWAENGVPEAHALLERAKSLDPENTVARGLLPDHWDDAPPPMLPAMSEEPATAAPAATPTPPGHEEAAALEISWLESLIPGAEPAPQAEAPAVGAPSGAAPTAPQAASEPSVSAEPAEVQPATAPLTGEPTASSGQAAALPVQVAPSQPAAEVAKVEEAAAPAQTAKLQPQEPAAAVEAVPVKSTGETKPARRMQPSLPRIGPTIPGALDKLPAWLHGSLGSAPQAASSAPAATAQEPTPAIAASLGALSQAQQEKTETAPEMTSRETHTLTGAAAPSTDMPEWLARAREAVRSGQVEENLAATSAPEEKPAWRTEADAETAQKGERPSTSEGLKVDSMGTSGEAPAQVEEPLPEWLAASEGASQTETPPSNSGLLEWLGSSQEADSPDVPSTASSVPTWLKPTEAEPLPKASPPEAAIPEWLQTLAPNELQPAPPPAAEPPAAEAPPAGVEETIPEWLREIMEAKEGERTESDAAALLPEPAETGPALPVQRLEPPKAEALTPANPAAAPVVEAGAVAVAPEPSTGLAAELARSEPPHGEAMSVPTGEPEATVVAGEPPVAAVEHPLAVARRAWASGDHARAIELYENALQSGPTFTPDVIADFEQFIQEPDAPVPAHRLLGDAYSMVGRYKEALEQYRIVLGK